jgi:hypothetical protein
MRRIRLALALVPLVAALSGCGLQDSATPLCPREGRNLGGLILMAQAVPSAAYVPCIQDVPAGWRFAGGHVQNGRAEFWLDSDRAGFRALTVLLTPTCDTSKAVEVPPEAGEPVMRRFEEPTALPPTFSGNRYYVFPGGCVTYRFSFVRGATFGEAVQATEALTFVSRAEGVAALAQEGLVLCGRGAPKCPG